MNMLKPKSKLPFDLSDMGEYGFHITTQKSDGGELITDAFCDENDVKYLHQAANNFPKAIELLKEFKFELNNSDDLKYSLNKLEDKIEEFLKSLEEDGK